MFWYFSCPRVLHLVSMYIILETSPTEIQVTAMLVIIIGDGCRYWQFGTKMVNDVYNRLLNHVPQKIFLCIFFIWEPCFLNIVRISPASNEPISHSERGLFIQNAMRTCPTNTQSITHVGHLLLSVAFVYYKCCYSSKPVTEWEITGFIKIYINHLIRGFGNE